MPESFLELAPVQRMIISMSLCARALSNGTITNDPEARVTLKVILAILNIYLSNILQK